MELDETQRAAVELAGDVKGALVDYALSPPFERHARRIARELAQTRLTVQDPPVAVVERLLFQFRYDDGSTVVDRFVQRRGLSTAEQDMARGFLDGVEGFFEVLADAPARATVFPVRCCLSELDHMVAPTQIGGVPELRKGSFIVGRLNPVAGTDLWTTSGAHEVLPAESRAGVADAVLELSVNCPWLTHRNPEKKRQALEQVAASHERFVAQHGDDLAVVAGNGVADLFANVMVPVEDREPAEVESARAMARQNFDAAELAEEEEVLVCSHPVAGLGFYRGLGPVVRALEDGAEADPGDMDVLRDYLDDDSVPSWVKRRIVTDRLPTSEAALQRALDRPAFSWSGAGEQLLASLPGDQEPTLRLAIAPSMCAPDAQSQE